MRLLDAVTPLPFQGGLDLPGAVAFAAVAPDRAHVAGDRIRTLGFGMPGHPVAGGAGNARYPASRRYRVAGGVGPYHACLRANTGAACSETSTSISNCRSRLPGSTGSFRPGVRLSAARAEPLSRMPRTRRRGVDHAMSCPALISRDGLPLSHDCTICRLNASSWWRGCSGPAIVGLQSHVIRPSSDCLIHCSQSNLCGMSSHTNFVYKTKRVCVRAETIRTRTRFILNYCDEVSCGSALRPGPG